MLDFQRLSKYKADFIWDERLYYPTGDYIANWIKRKGFDLISLKRYREGEDHIVLTAIKRDRMTKIKTEYPMHLETGNICIDGLIKKRRERWKEIMQGIEGIHIIGTSHKSMMLSWFISQDNPVKVNYWDGSAKKVGNMWENNIIKDISEIESCEDNEGRILVVFSFWNEIAKDIWKNIVNKKNNAKMVLLKDIF